MCFSFFIVLYRSLPSYCDGNVCSWVGYNKGGLKKLFCWKNNWYMVVLENFQSYILYISLLLIEMKIEKIYYGLEELTGSIYLYIWLFLNYHMHIINWKMARMCGLILIAITVGMTMFMNVSVEGAVEYLNATQNQYLALLMGAIQTMSCRSKFLSKVHCNLPLGSHRGV